LGYSLVIFLVGIRNIPATYLEAASLDGASELQKFWRVTLPLLRPILLYVLVTSTINAYNVFNHLNYGTPSPNSNGADGPFGNTAFTSTMPTSPYGAFAAAATDQRICQIQGKFVF